MRKVLITGAGGFIGGALAKYLLDKGVIVIGVDVSLDKMEFLSDYKNFSKVVATFEQYSRLHEIIADRDIDVFYHFAWQGVFGVAFQNYEMQLNNAKYSCIAVDEAIKMNVKKFVFAGTMNEYEMDNYIHCDYFEPRYTYIYSAVKQVSEAIGKTLAYNKKIEYCVGRIAMAFGEKNNSDMLPNVVMRNLLNGNPCKLIAGEGKYDMIYIDDIVAAFEAIGEHGKNMKSYYIGHRKLRTFREIITEISCILNPQCELLFGAYPDVPSGVDYDKIDLDALYRDTKFECKADFKESVLKTASWLGENDMKVRK